MQTTKITYWISSSVIAAMITFSAYAYLTQPTVREGFHHLGFPDYFRVELAIAKFIAAVLILIPVASRIKEWVYAGLTIVFISAFVAHAASADPVANLIGPSVFLILLAVSYVTYYKIQSNKKVVMLQS